MPWVEWKTINADRFVEAAPSEAFLGCALGRMAAVAQALQRAMPK
jgi:hypothetical protein